MEFKIGETVHCLGMPGKYEIIADREFPETSADKPPFFIKRTLVEGFDFIIGQHAENRASRPVFLYALKSQLRKAR